MELFRLLGTIAIDNSGANSAIDNTTDRAEGAHDKIARAFQKVGSAAVAVGKTIATGLAVGSAAVAALTKSAISAYADYEQLVGGVETLFGTGGKSLEEYAKSVGKTTDEVKHEYMSLLNAQKSVMENADKAYKTAGLSANEYMETVTSFSAALINSLDGDTAKAAEKADQAIIDMADNANKMGSNMESIQNAYQGFAKQNYTMLDNLKLGYGGTQTEMYRLMEDAAKLDKTFADNAVFSIDSKGHLEAKYSDIVDAIHIVQTEMGITGTTAKEASSTISGSIASMKSAWSNLVTGLGNDNANLSSLVTKFIDSAVVAADNILPRIEVIFGGISQMATQLIPKITKKLPEMLNTMLPPLIEGTVALFNGLVSALPSLLKILVEQIPFVVSQIAQGLASAFPVLLETIKDLFSQIWGYLSSDEVKGTFRNALVKLFGEDAVATLEGTFQSIKESISPLIDAFKKLGGAIGENAEGSTFFQDAFSVMADAISAVWSNVVQPVYDAITDAINWLAENWSVISANISAAFQTLWDVCSSIWTNVGQPIWDMISFAVGSLASLFSEHMPEIMAFFQNAIAGIKDTWENHLKPVFEAIGKILNDYVKPAFEFVWKAIVEPLIESVFGTIERLWTNTLKPVFDGICDFLTGVFTNDWEKAFSGIISIVTGIWNGLVEIIQKPIDIVKDIINGAVEYIQEKFDFDWKLPKLALPHFKISGSFSLDPPSVPSFGIEWYAKAMDNPMIMDKPTAFGINSLGQIMAGGEAGSEVVSGTDTLMNMIASAVAAQNGALVAILYKILDAILAMDENMGGNMREALDGTTFEVNYREFARLVKAVN